MSSKSLSLWKRWTEGEDGQRKRLAERKADLDLYMDFIVQIRSRVQLAGEQVEKIRNDMATLLSHTDAAAHTPASRFMKTMADLLSDPEFLQREVVKVQDLLDAYDTLDRKLACARAAAATDKKRTLHIRNIETGAKYCLVASIYALFATVLALEIAAAAVGNNCGNSSSALVLVWAQSSDKSYGSSVKLANDLREDQRQMRDAVDKAYEGLQVGQVNLVQLKYIGEDMAEIQRLARQRMESAMSLCKQNGDEHGKSNMLVWKDSIEQGYKALGKHVKTIDDIKSETYEHLISMKTMMASARVGSELARV